MKFRKEASPIHKMQDEAAGANVEATSYPGLTKLSGDYAKSKIL